MDNAARHRPPRTSARHRPLGRRTPINPSRGRAPVVASIVAAEDDSGLSLRQLIDDCRSALLGTPDLWVPETLPWSLTCRDGG